MVISKKKNVSLRIDLIFPTFRPNFIIISKKHIQQNKTIWFRGGLKIEGGPKKRGARGNCLIRLTQYSPPKIIEYFSIQDSKVLLLFFLHDGLIIFVCLINYYGFVKRRKSWAGTSQSIQIQNKNYRFNTLDSTNKEWMYENWRQYNCIASSSCKFCAAHLQYLCIASHGNRIDNVISIKINSKNKALF